MVFRYAHGGGSDLRVPKTPLEPGLAIAGLIAAASMIMLVFTGIAQLQLMDVAEFMREAGGLR